VYYTINDNYLHLSSENQDNPVGIGAGRHRFDSQYGQELFLFSTASRPALGPLSIKRLGREADLTPLPSAKVKNGRDIPPLLRTYPWSGA
jgi:hypothetical protein